MSEKEQSPICHPELISLRNTLIILENTYYIQIVSDVLGHEK